MPDELTNQPVGTEQAPDGQPEQLTEGSQANGAPARTDTGVAPVNQEPMVRQSDLRALQSLKDRQLAELRAEMQAMQARLRDSETRGMDEDELRVYNLRQKEIELQQREQALYAQAQDVERNNLFLQINQETGIPIQFLNENASGPDHAWRLGAQYMKLLQQNVSQQRQAQGQEAQRQRSNAGVDVGSGAPTNSSPRQAYEQAIKSGNAQAAVRAYRAAKLAEAQSK